MDVIFWGFHVGSVSIGACASGMGPAIVVGVSGMGYGICLVGWVVALGKGVFLYWVSISVLLGCSFGCG